MNDLVVANWSTRGDKLKWIVVQPFLTKVYQFKAFTIIYRTSKCFRGRLIVPKALRCRNDRNKNVKTIELRYDLSSVSSYAVALAAKKTFCRTDNAKRGCSGERQRAIKWGGCSSGDEYIRAPNGSHLQSKVEREEERSTGSLHLSRARCSFRRKNHYIFVLFSTRGSENKFPPIGNFH